MRVLAFGTYDIAAHPRVAVLLDGLRSHGHEVEECNIPLGVSTHTRVTTLQQPWRIPLLVFTVLRRWLGLARKARRLDPPDVVLVGYLGQLDVLLARRLFRRTLVVLDLLVSGAETISDRQLGGRLAARAVSWLDRRAVAAADVVVVDTEEHRELVPGVRRAETVVAAVGATDEWFDAGAPAGGVRRSDGPLRVVFFGLYTPLQGAPVIGAALRLLADEPIEVTMVGHGQERAATQAAAEGNDRVTWVRWIDLSELPPLVARHDVCLGIFGTSAKAFQVVPTKVYQGLAAGTVVVTSDTPPQRRVLGPSAVLVAPGDPDALARTLRDLAHDPDRVRTLRQASSAAAPAIASAEAVTAGLARALAERVPGIAARDT